MRALFTVQPSVGHLHPLVPVARALSGAGHDVAICSAPSFRPEVEAFGLTHVDAGLDWLMSDQATWEVFPPMPPPGPEFPAWAVLTLADITTGRMVPDLLAIAREWRADLIVREGMEYGGCIAAEALGLPHASIAGNAYAAIDSPEINYFPGNRRMVAEPLARHREEVGLPPDPETEMPFRHLHLCFMPPTWDGASVHRPRNAHFLRHISTVSPGAALPDWVERLPDRPTVFASLGTVFNKTPGVLEAIVEALAAEPINVIVAIGRDQDPGRFGPSPTTSAWRPTSRSRCCSRTATPSSPTAASTASRRRSAQAFPWLWSPSAPTSPTAPSAAQTSGWPARSGPTTVPRTLIREAVRQVLAEPSYRDNARAFQAKMRALPGPEEMVEMIESLRG